MYVKGPLSPGYSLDNFLKTDAKQIDMIPEIIQPKILIDPNADKEIGNIKIPAPIMLPTTSVNDSLNSILFSILCTLFTI